MTKPREVLYEGKWLRLVKVGHWESCERTHHASGMAVIIIAVTTRAHAMRPTTKRPLAPLPSSRAEPQPESRNLFVGP